jgi:hypothetical protein
MIPNPYTFAVLAVTRQFPEVLASPLSGGGVPFFCVPHSWYCPSGFAILSLHSYYHLQRWMSWLE